MRHFRLMLVALAAIWSAGALPALAQDDPPSEEIKLTAETVKQMIAATKEMQSLDPAASGEVAETTPSTELDAELDGIAKKHGFADGDAYGKTFESAVQAFAVVDWTSEHRKKAAAAEIAAITADKELPEDAKKAAIALIEQDLAAPPPQALPENVELIKAHEAEMRELLESDIGP